MVYDFIKVGKRIKEERKRLPKGERSQEKFSETIGISKPTLCRIEKGQDSECFFNALLRMCEIFDCEIGYLLCEYDTKKREYTDIIDYTGLSSYAIETLNRYKRLSEYPENCFALSMINAFISYGDFMAVQDDLTEIYKLKNLYKGKEGKEKYQLEYGKFEHHFENCEQEIKYLEFCAFNELQNGLNSFFDEYYKSNETDNKSSKRKKGGNKNSKHN